MILIVSNGIYDPTVVRLSEALQRSGADYVVAAIDTMATAAALVVERDADSGKSVLHLNDRAIDLRDVHAAWLWRNWSPDEHDPALRHLYEQRRAWGFFKNEWQHFSRGLMLLLRYHGVFCVNPPPFNFAFEEKCCQLWLAAECGLHIPATLYTTHLPFARDWYDRSAGALIYKPFGGYIDLIETPHRPLRIQRLLTNRVKAEDLVEAAGHMPTPSIFQPYIEKQLELRIVVIGHNVFACAIHSQQSERSREDWRRYDFEHTPYEPYTLPDEITQKILAFMERTGLAFGSIDMILTPAGEYVFLELNPNGQFDWVAQRAGLPLYEHLAAMLCAGRIDYPAPLR